MIRRFSAACLFVCACLAVFLPPADPPPRHPAARRRRSAREADAFFDRRQYKEAIAATTSCSRVTPTPSTPSMPGSTSPTPISSPASSSPPWTGCAKLLASPTTPPEMLEQAAGLLPAGARPTGRARSARATPKRTAGVRGGHQGIRRVSSPNIPAAPPWKPRSTAARWTAYQIARYDDAARELRQNLAAFPASETILDSEFLLVHHARHAGQPRARQGKPHARRGRRGLQATTPKRKNCSPTSSPSGTDISLANDAQFQLGETLLAHAGNSPRMAARRRSIQQALAAYRAVQPKEGMIAAQTARVARINDARIAELRKGAAADRALDPPTRRPAAARAGQARSPPGEGRPRAHRPAPMRRGVLRPPALRRDARAHDRACARRSRKPEDEKLVLYYTALSYAGQRTDRQGGRGV